nr:hypothetical protein CFP56_09576 [Quercus suber]
MSSSVTRRNGRNAACEPCRAGKLRCDHTKPRCLRCLRRSIASSCFYHPAPMTQPRTSGLDGIAKGYAFDIRHSIDDTDPILAGPSNTALIGANGPAQVSPRNSVSDHVRPGMSRSADLQGPSALRSTLGARRRTDRRIKVVSHVSHGDDFGFSDKIGAVVEILAQLSHMTLIRHLLREYTTHSQAALVPGTIVLEFASSLAVLASRLPLEQASDKPDGLVQAAQNMLNLSSTTALITAEFDLAGFLAAYTGEHLRLETVGLCCVLAARACAVGLAGDDDKREDFVRSMYTAGARCLQLAREVAPGINDVMLWLAFEDLQQDADSRTLGPGTWRRLGDLSSDVLASGIHRDGINAANVPFFLSECRRKTFAAAYHFDKFVSTLLDRPPRILRRYSDCTMPLDLSDDELLGVPEVVQQARDRLTDLGWNTDGRYAPATWQRLRYVLGVFREEIQEYPYRPSDPPNNAKLKYEIFLIYNLFSHFCRDLTTDSQRPIYANAELDGGLTGASSL